MKLPNISNENLDTSGKMNKKDVSLLTFGNDEKPKVNLDKSMDKKSNFRENAVFRSGISMQSHNQDRTISVLGSIYQIRAEAKVIKEISRNR